MITVIYREALKSDLTEIVSIYNATIASKMVTADTEAVTIESREKWFEEHDLNRRPLWIVEDIKGETLAWVSFQSFYGRPAYEATAEISIYITEGRRGFGLGKQILEYSLRQAPIYGIKTVLGFIFAHNLPSVSLFLSLGFESWGNLPKVASMEEQEYDLLILGKRLVL